jgi:prohibitin 1
MIEMEKMLKIIRGNVKESFAIGVLGFILFIIFFTTQVPAGFGGVIYSTNGGVEDVALSQGWHIVSPFKFVTDYPISTENVEVEEFNISTKDGKNVEVDISYNYRMNFEELPNIYTKFRGRSENAISDGYFKDRLKESCNVISTTMDVLEVYGEKRQDLNNMVFDRFKKQLDEVGVTLETFAFTRVEPDENSLKAIQQKVDARQKLEKMKIEKEQAIVDSEMKKIIVEADVERKLISSKAYAERKILEAEAVAKANRLLNQSLTDKILQHNRIKAWDGKYPQVIGNESMIYNLK